MIYCTKWRSNIITMYRKKTLTKKTTGSRPVTNISPKNTRSPRTAAAPKRANRKQNKSVFYLLFFLFVLGLSIFFIVKNRTEKETSGSIRSTEATPMSESAFSTEATPMSESAFSTEAAPTPEPVFPENSSVSAVSNETSADKLFYTDDRVPNYSGANPQWESFRFEWNRQDNLGTMYLELSLDAEMYRYYRSLSRYQGIENYHNYINDANNKAIISNIVSTIRDVANDLSYSDAAVVREVAKFVQDTIEYQYDSSSTDFDEYPRYPIETLYEGQGDCEDTSILLVAMLHELGYEVGFLHIPGHVAVALRTSDDYNLSPYYEINGHRYLFIESTGSGWNIGDIPEEYQETSVTLYLIP